MTEWAVFIFSFFLYDRDVNVRPVKSAPGRKQILAGLMPFLSSRMVSVSTEGACTGRPSAVLTDDDLALGRAKQLLHGGSGVAVIYLLFVSSLLCSTWEVESLKRRVILSEAGHKRCTILRSMRHVQRTNSWRMRNYCAVVVICCLAVHYLVTCFHSGNEKFR